MRKSTERPQLLYRPAGWHLRVITGCLLRFSEKGGSILHHELKGIFIAASGVVKSEGNHPSSPAAWRRLQLLSTLQESEIQLLQDAKRFTVKLEEQQQELEKAEQFPESATSEVSKLRQQYLRYFNEYNAIQEREFEIQYRLNSLLEDKKLIEKEYRKIPKSSDADKKIKALRDSCEDLRKETTQRRQEIKTLKDDLFARHKRLTKEHKELEELFRKQEELKVMEGDLWTPIDRAVF
ncbi:hypothetical protein Chor_002515 [Crotalus horridus]